MWFICDCEIVLTFSHQNDSIFQDVIKNIFKDEEDEKSVKYQSAPVKTYDRCLIKSNTDYGSESYPTGACISDLMRCSITFENTKNLLEWLEKFLNLVDNGKIECLTKILRIKNGFKDILNWKSIKDAAYCDLKLNVLYQNESKTESQIVEVRTLVYIKYVWYYL